MNMLARRLALLATAAAIAAIAATTGCGQKKPSSNIGSDSDSGSGSLSSKELGDAAANIKKTPFVNTDVGNAMQAMSKVMAQSENVTITPVDFRVLREMLPETAGALKRKSREGQKEMGMSTATAEYGDESGNATINIKISDTGQMRAMMAGGMAASLSLDMDKETEDGYDRNITFQGLRAHERKSGDNVELTTLAGDRFMVEINGYNVKPEQLKAVLESIPLKKLVAMKDDGIEKSEPAK